jgi:hypothetical protein
VIKPIKPEDFTAHFRTEYFDFGYQQGLGVWLKKNNRRHAVRIEHNDPPKKVADSLRALADWIERNAE